jgi:general stress protein 26
LTSAGIIAAVMLNDSARELLASGVVIYVATRDAALAPEIAPAMGIQIDDPARVTLFLPRCEATTRTLRNLEDNKQLAATFCRPHDHRTVQVKGTVRAVRDADPGDRCTQEIYRGAFAEQLALVGVPRSVTRRFRFSPAVAITLDIEHVRDQTPGPRAGMRIAG